MLYLSSTNETTPGTALSSCITGSYVPKAPGWPSASIRGYTVTRIGLASIVLGGLGGGAMAENLDVVNTAVSLLIRATLLAARFSGRVRRRSLKRPAAMDADAKDKEILFLKDRVYQLEMQVSIPQKRLNKKGKKPRYEVRERLLILWHMEAFQIPRRKVSRYFGIARSTLYRWLHKIEDEKPSGTPANKTPTEIASLVWEIPKANLSWGRIRIANQLKLLGIFLSASTVRNILQRPEPRNTPTTSVTAPGKTKRSRKRVQFLPGIPITCGRSTPRRFCVGACGPFTS
jgi:transposase